MNGKRPVFLTRGYGGGKLIRMPVKDIRIAGRNTMGVIMFRLNDSEHVVSCHFGMGEQLK